MERLISGWCQSEHSHRFMSYGNANQENRSEEHRKLRSWNTTMTMDIIAHFWPINFHVQNIKKMINEIVIRLTFMWVKNWSQNTERKQSQLHFAVFPWKFMTVHKNIFHHFKRFTRSALKRWKKIPLYLFFVKDEFFWGLKSGWREKMDKKILILHSLWIIILKRDFFSISRGFSRNNQRDSSWMWMMMEFESESSQFISIYLCNFLRWIALILRSSKNQWIFNLLICELAFSL